MNGSSHSAIAGFRTLDFLFFLVSLRCYFPLSRQRKLPQLSGSSRPSSGRRPGPPSGMDSITSSALEEICAQGTTGLLLSSLWPKLGPELSSCGLGLSPPVKSSVWANLLQIPALEFHARNAAFTPTDPSIQSVEDAEKMKLKLVAKESLRDNFVGLYDAQSAISNISSRQRLTLERLAAAR